MGIASVASAAANTGNPRIKNQGRYG